MVNKPDSIQGPEERAIPLATLRDDGTSRCSSADSSNGFESPNGGEETSQRSLLPKTNARNGSKPQKGVALRQQSRSRPPLSNIGFGESGASCSIEDEKAYTTIPLSPLSTDDGLMNDSISTRGNKTVTMTGTIRRGQKPVQVQLELTEQELKALNRSSIIEEDKKGDCMWGWRKGLHIVFLSFLFIPLAFLSSLFVCFYVGTICWYNVYLYLSEERTIWHRIFLCPLLIIFYPLLIVVMSFCLALVAAFKQISWYFSSWYREINDFDKGVFGWICTKLDVPQCAPYEVVILDENLSTPASIGDTTVAQTAV